MLYVFVAAVQNCLCLCCNQSIDPSRAAGFVAGGAKCVKVSPVLRDTLRVTGSEKLFVTNYVFLAK